MRVPAGSQLAAVGATGGSDLGPRSICVVPATSSQNQKTSVGPGGRQLRISGRMREARSSRGGNEGTAARAVGLAADVGVGTGDGGGVGAAFGAAQPISRAAARTPARFR